MIIHEEKLTGQEAQELEDVVRQKYIDNGWNCLNTAKTGKNIGSLGNIGVKWTYDACYSVAKKM